MEWTLICDRWFHAIFTRQSSGRERKILKKSEKIEKYSQKNVYVRIAYNSFLFYFFMYVCVCVHVLCVGVYVIVTKFVFMMIYAPRGNLRLSPEYMCSDVLQLSLTHQKTPCLTKNQKYYPNADMRTKIYFHISTIISLSITTNRHTNSTSVTKSPYTPSRITLQHTWRTVSTIFLHWTFISISKNPTTSWYNVSHNSWLVEVHLNIVSCKSVTVVEGERKAPFSIVTAPKRRGGRYSFPWIATLYPWYVPYIAEC